MCFLQTAIACMDVSTLGCTEGVVVCVYVCVCVCVCVCVWNVWVGQAGSQKRDPPNPQLARSIAQARCTQHCYRKSSVRLSRVFFCCLCSLERRKVPLSVQGQHLCGDETSFSPGGYKLAALAAGGTLEGLKAVMEGRASSSYVLARPPGLCLPS